MAKLEEKYESIVVISTKLEEEKIKALVEKIKQLIVDNGNLENVDEWGKRKLAYDIHYESEGYYVMYNFNSVPSFPSELDRIYQITDGILRTLTVIRDS